ncbi:MAG TPA: GMC family oxidoreductase [Gaiellaceae bacterium]
MADYDIVIVGAGPVGAILARVLGSAAVGSEPLRILVLEAGPAVGRTWSDYQANVDHYLGSSIKVPNAPWVSSAYAPSPDVLDVRPLTPDSIPDDNGYFVQYGPLPFESDYVRAQGGTMLHWLATSLRMVPNDFEIRSRYGHGLDWPVSYDELQPYYERAEWELGVSANVEDQEYLGITFRDGYHFPMSRIPLSYLDEHVAGTVDGLTVTLDGEATELLVSSTPQARNSTPNPGYRPIGAHGAEHMGLRCEGNSSCIPICPVQAKYSPLKTWGLVSRHVEVRTQCVVSKVIYAGSAPDAPVAALEYYSYTDGLPPPATPERVTADIYVLAGNAIENPKLLLASEPTPNDNIGRHLMDHPYVLSWALMPENIGAYRGPSSTSGIEVLRDGAFRKDRAAFRMEVVNWGWDFITNSPFSDLESAVDKGLYGAELRAEIADRVPRQFRFGFLYEQLPDPGNRVFLNNGYVDALGIPRPCIAYDVDDYVRKGMVASQGLSESLFAALGATEYTRYSDSKPGYVTYDGWPFNFVGAGHLAGTHCMGTKRSNSAVDSFQRSWEHENLYLIGCGSMPTVSTSNPSLTMAALAFRSAEAILDDLGVR